MRLANVDNRLCLVVNTGVIDVEKASDARFDASPGLIYPRWDEFVTWAASATLPEPSMMPDPALLGPPAPTPAQVFAIGLNYSEHANETGFAQPDSQPPVFTKFASSLSGPYADVRLPESGHTDWEVELLAVIGRRAVGVATSEALDYVAGLTAGQDLSERVLQMAATPPQFSLGKSFPGFGPMGPHLVTIDEFDDPNDLALGCAINGETVQQGRTRDLIFSVPELIAQLSHVLPLLPGDVIFTGTPAGVGDGRTPPRFLAEGDELVSFVEGIGELRQRFVR